MAIEDALRWNQRYSQNYDFYRQTIPRNWLVDHAAEIPENGIALDLAMGLGENAGYLLKRGWRVIGVDISIIAVRKAQTKFPNMLAVVADLTDNLFVGAGFDLILNFYFLQRKLVHQFKSLLKPGGFVLMETLMMPMKSIKPDIPVEYLLQEGELRTLFDTWNILDYREGWFTNSSNGQKAIASVFAKTAI
jgi:tellurite methyltransferase